MPPIIPSEKRSIDTLKISTDRPAPVLFAVAGLKLVQRLVPFDLRAAHNDVAGVIYAVTGVVYAVLLVFALISTWQDYETAKVTTESEANELAEIYFRADRLSDLERAWVKGSGPVVRPGRGGGRMAADGATRNDAGLVLYDEKLTRVRNLAEARRLRSLPSARRG